MNPHLRSHLGALAGFVAATIIATWPLAIDLTRGVPYGGDAFQFIWNGWWFAKAANDPSLSIWFTPFQYAPHGAPLALHDLSPLNAYLQAWLRAFVGDFGAYNLLVIFHYILGAWGAYILAWYLTGNRAGSVIAGFIYGFSTHHAMHLSQLSTVSSGWVPLSVYYMLKYTRDAGPRDGVLAALMLLAAAMSSWYHLAFAGVVFFGLMLIGQIGLRDSLGGWRRWQRAIIPWLVAILILSPILCMAFTEALKQPVEWRVGMGRLYFLDPAWAIIPPPHHPICGPLVRPLIPTIPGNMTEGVASLGPVAIVLGILAWFRRNATSRAWCWLGLILFLLALGPTIAILGMKTGIPGPFRLWSMIPGLNMVRVPARFVAPFTLTLALSAAGFIAGLRPRWRTGGRRIFLLWVLPILALFETLVIPIPMTGSELNLPALSQLSSIYRNATGDPNPPDLMVNFPALPERVQFMYQQTLHRIPTIDGALSNPPPGARDFLFHFNWNAEYLRSIGVDLVLYQYWAATSSLGEVFQVGTGEQYPVEWRGQKVPPLVFFREVEKYRVIYEDDKMIVFVP